MTNILERINQPKDLRKLNLEELNSLADEMRKAIIKKVNTTGGHMGPNLGFIEPTIALHYVFNSPVDKIVFDVSHQSYPHKMLTGRRENFTNPEKYFEISGYTNPQESEHDTFFIGHTSTSVSLSVGLAKARDLKGEKSNIIAIIGDGSLSGGEAFEGLDNAAVLNSNIIIIVNDNDMSIAPNHGGIYANLQLLKETEGKAECNFFKSMGFEYLFVKNGNNIEELINAFQKVKDIDHPVIIHLHTLKGKGLEVAEKNKESFHWILPGTLDKKEQSNSQEATYNSITTDYLIEKRMNDKTVIAISPATPGAYGFTPEFREKMGEGYTDVGICEEHAVAYASGLARNGAKPVLAIMSSFVQRTYDQLSQDLALNNSPATILVHWGAISGGDATHLGCFDIPLISNIPNIVYLTPTCKEEYLKMLDWSIEQTYYPVAIRVPFGPLISNGKKDNTDYSKLNKYKIEEEGETVAILGLGNFFHLGKTLKEELKNKLGINATLINPKFISGLDKELLESLNRNHKIVVTLEDGVKDGGFGEKIASYYGKSGIKVLNYGADKEFTDRVPIEELYKRYHLTKEQITDDIKICL